VFIDQADLRVQEGLSARQGNGVDLVFFEHGAKDPFNIAYGKSMEFLFFPDGAHAAMKVALVRYLERQIESACF